ncbi:excisionase family DNA binding protein [Saccharopolyspora erythraea NRRL 2338]|uniref:Uncharacterized protein n=2 Tax=Saccharopolyspora erythraea TaxID=1836 RepID=A4F8U4_SACEN|nr:helix-turn-helix domain-containing protein [Saccharopolyspora erythraea]PFG94264.1 excisionase family DNA binding protein [Saccharopolyspora erythraea NRRL 2338]CAM00469.1 hypothetical protein SACE_1138 [Saccharopolyspora erythraea NRRL 2338]
MQVNGSSTRMYRVKAVADMLDVHVSTVYRLIDSKRLHAVRVGGLGKGAVRIPADALETFLQRVGIKSASDEVA